MVDAVTTPLWEQNNTALVKDMGLCSCDVIVETS